MWSAIPSAFSGDQVVKDQLQNVIERVDELEVENNAMRNFIVVDEEWHFRDELAKAARGEEPDPTVPERITWVVFVERWKSGWRPRNPADYQPGWRPRKPP